MQSPSAQRLRKAANLSILLVSVTLAAVLVTKFWLPRRSAPIEPLQPGAQVMLPGVRWDSRATLILAVSKRCPLCSESAPFYRRLVPQATGKGIPIVAVSPESDAESRGFLRQLGVEVSQVTQVDFRRARIAGTPTLVLVDRSGRVLEVWRGRLSPQVESKVLDRIEHFDDAESRLDHPKGAKS